MCINLAENFSWNMCVSTQVVKVLQLLREVICLSVKLMWVYTYCFFSISVKHDEHLGV